MRILLIFSLFICSLFATSINLTQCDKNPDFCHNIAVSFYEGDGVDKNLTIAYKYFNEACNKGFLQSCFNVGLMSLNGNGIKKDEFMAFDMFKKTCVKNKNGYKSTDGCGNLAMLYIDGVGIRQDFERGIQILDDSCKAGVVKNCKSLSMIYEDGYLGIDSNSTKAMEILKYACDKKKDANSCAEVSAMMFKVSDQNGTGYLKKACEFSLDEACLNLGLMYTNAQFVEQNLTMAKEYFGTACDLRNATGCESYKLLYQQEVEANKTKKSIDKNNTKD